MRPGRHADQLRLQPSALAASVSHYQVAEQRDRPDRQP
jgi:hypothetical protein